MTYPIIGEVKLAEPISIRMTPNGGWIVFQQENHMVMPKEIGAYTSAKEMLDALASVLLPEPEIISVNIDGTQVIRG